MVMVLMLMIILMKMLRCQRTEEKVLYLVYNNSLYYFSDFQPRGCVPNGVAKNILVIAKRDMRLCGAGQHIRAQSLMTRRAFKISGDIHNNKFSTSNFLVLF